MTDQSAAMERHREYLHPEPVGDEREPATFDEICDYVWGLPDARDVLLDTFLDLPYADQLEAFDCMVNRTVFSFRPSTKFAALIEKRFQEAANQHKWGGE